MIKKTLITLSLLAAVFVATVYAALLGWCLRFAVVIWFHVSPLYWSQKPRPSRVESDRKLR